MFMTIQRFSFGILLSSLILFISLFYYNYTLQEDKTASVIFNTLRSSLAETAYVVSRNTKSKTSINYSRPLLDRIAAHNEFISAIVIHNENSILVTTDPHYETILETDVFHGDTIRYEDLVNAQSLEEDIRFYEGKEQIIFKLVYILDKKEIANYFIEKKSSFLFDFVFIPIVILLIIGLLMRRFIVKPLELLRQFAYYKNSVPNAFHIREFETIRYSMVQTFQRLEEEKQELYTMARTDSLSGLSNRNALNEYLERLIKSSSRNKQEFAFLFLDLDHFKNVNDSLGHNVGDELLKHVASFISEVLRSNDFVARVGGDEFVIIIQEYHTLYDLTTVIQRIQEQLSKTFIVQTQPITISSSIGIAMFPKDGEDIVSLMQHADMAMYEAKKDGRARYSFYTDALNEKVQSLILLNKEMKEALYHKEYQLYYQPKMDIVSGKIVGAEALIRWIHPEKGMILPDKFIPEAEENGFIVELGDWIIEEAVKQQTVFKKKGLDIIISINISAKQFLKDDFVANLLGVLEKYDVRTDKIDLEITEYMLFKQNKENCQVLYELHKHGFSISLDDFGTGYSSLAYLKKFPISYIKIDKAFIDDLDTQEGAIFVDVIVKMGHALNMKIIAEGVEKIEQIQYLKNIDCNECQGYYFSKPIPADKFIENFVN